MHTLNKTMDNLHRVVQRLEGQSQTTVWDKEEIFDGEQNVKNRKAISELLAYLTTLRESPFYVRYHDEDSIVVLYSDGKVEITHSEQGFWVKFDCFTKKEAVYAVDDPEELMRRIAKECDRLLDDWYEYTSFGDR